MRTIISILCRDQFGTLSRIIELFSSRGFNLTSICSGSCEEVGMQRMTLLIQENEKRIGHIIKMINGIVDVVEAHQVDVYNSISREMLLVKVKFARDQRVELMNLIRGNQGNIIEMTTESVCFELTGASQKLDRLITIFRDFEIIQLARTGEAAINNLNQPTTNGEI